ncbi:UNVERIFIED_CONTAM: hypothetical protein FKN15_003749 [Acipenser sinensis]
MKEACRICARDLCGNQRRWIFHPASKLSLQVLLSHVLGREVSRDGKGEFACSKCTFMLDRMYRFDTVIARIEALSIERLQKLLQEKHRLRHCVISLYRKNNCDEQGQEKPVDCTVDISGLSDVKYNALFQEDFVYSGYESWAEHEEQTVEPHVHSNVSEISLHKSRKCRGCASLRVSDSDYEAVCKVPRKVARSISCGPSTRYSASMLGSVCSEDPMTMTPLPESMIVSLPSDKTLEDTDLLEKMSPASSVEFLDTAVEMGSSARKEEETDRELKEDQKSDSWSEEHLAQCSTAAHTNKLDQALMLVKTFEYRPIQSPQGSKLPVLVKSPGCNCKLVFSDMPTGTPHNNICEFPSRFQELVPPQVQQELQLELADLEKLWEDVYVEYLPFCSQNLIEEQQSQLNQYECAAGQCVSELQKAQLQVQTLQTKIQETEAANEMLHQKLMEMECELRAIRQASQKKERTIQGLSEAVSSKDSEIIFACPDLRLGNSDPDSAYLSSAEEVEEDEDDDDDDGSTDYTDSIEEKENLKLTALSLSTNQNVVTHEQGEMAGGSGSSNGVSQVDKEGLLEMRSEIQQLMEQKKAAESELRELKTQLENTGYASLSQMRNAMQSLRLENEQLKSLAGHVTLGWWQKGEAGGLSEEGLRQEVGRLKGRLGTETIVGLLKEQMRLTCQDCGEEGVFSPELIVNVAHKIRERLREEPGPVQGTCSAPEVQLREGSGKRKRSTRPHSLDLGALLSQSTSESSLQAGLQMDSERFWEHVEASVSEQSQQLRSELALSHQESHELQERLKVSEATLQAQSDQLKHYHVLLTEVSVERENKQVQVDLQDLGYETCGRSETEADREETSSPEYDELDVHGDLYSDARLLEEARPPLLPLKSSLKVQLWTEEEPVKCEDVTALQQHIQDLRAQLCRSEKVIRNLQTRIRSFSTTSDYASSLERPHKVAWSFEASPAHSCLEDDEGWQSDEVAIPAAQPNKELQELVSRVASLETRLKTSSLEGKAAAEDLKSATWPRKYDSLIQAQARELSHLRQKMRESRGVCHILSQHLGDTTKSFEELLRANDIDYYMGQSFREQLAQDTSLAERVSSKLSGRESSLL